MRKFLLTMCAAFLAFMPLTVYAGDAENVFGNITGEDGTLTQAAPAGLQNQSKTPAAVVSQLINTVVGFLGVIAVGLIIYAGGMWLTAAGDDNKVIKAKKIITRTLIGIAIVGMAYGITVL